MSTRRRSKTREEWIASLRYNIKDAKEALENAVKLGNWRSVIRYAEQLSKLTPKLYLAETGSLGPRRRMRVESIAGEHRRRLQARLRARELEEESPAGRRRALEARGWQFGKRDPARDRRKPKGSYALVRSRGLDDVVLSVHPTNEAAEAAMRKHGGDPHSMFQKGLQIVNVGPEGRWELVEVFGKWSVRPKHGGMRDTRDRQRRR